MFLKSFKVYAVTLLCLAIFVGCGKDLSKNYEIGINTQVKLAKNKTYKITPTFICSKSGDGVVCKNAELISKKLQSKDVSVYTNIFYENESKDRVSLAEVLKNIKLEKLFYDIDIKNAKSKMITFYDENGYYSMAKDNAKASIKNTFKPKTNEHKLLVSFDDGDIKIQLEIYSTIDIDEFIWALDNEGAHYDVLNQAVICEYELFWDAIMDTYFKTASPSKITLNISPQNKSTLDKTTKMIEQMLQTTHNHLFFTSLKQVFDNSGSIKLSFIYSGEHKLSDMMKGFWLFGFLQSADEIFINNKSYHNDIVLKVYEKKCDNKDYQSCEYLINFYKDKKDQQKFQKYLKKACNLGYKEHCNTKSEVDIYVNTKLKNLKIKCDNNDYNACYQLGYDLLYSDKVQKYE